MACNNKTILVTGAAGLIGREIYAQLTAQGHTVTGVDNCQRFPDFVPDGNFVKANLIEYLNSTTNEFNVIYHMAAINGTSNFYKNTNAVLANNVQIDLAVFKCVETNKNSKLVYASSSEIIAGTNSFPTVEEVDVEIINIHNPRWSYRLPKILSENYLVNSKINFVIVRFFNVFSEYSGYGHFVKDIISKFRNNNFDLIGPTETRSFCYVQDAVDAMIKIEEHADRDIVNIGSDEEISITEAAMIIADALQINIEKWNATASNDGSVSRRQPNIDKLKKYYPEFNPRTFKETINSIKEKL